MQLKRRLKRRRTAALPTTRMQHTHTFRFGRTVHRFVSKHRYALRAWYQLGVLCTMVLSVCMVYMLGYELLMSMKLLFQPLDPMSAVHSPHNGVLGRHTTLLLPGVTVPLSLLPGLVIAIAIAVAVHEAGHAIAALVEGVPVHDAGVTCLHYVLPAAYVNVDMAALDAVSKRRKLRVMCAGVWHNVLLCVVCWFAWYAVRQALQEGYVRTRGLVVRDVSLDSVLAQHLPINSMITGMGSCPVRKSEDWIDCLQRTAQERQVFGGCLPMSLLRSAPLCWPSDAADVATDGLPKIGCARSELCVVLSHTVGPRGALQGPSEEPPLGWCLPSDIYFQLPRCSPEYGDQVYNASAATVNIVNATATATPLLCSPAATCVQAFFPAGMTLYDVHYTLPKDRAAVARVDPRHPAAGAQGPPWGSHGAPLFPTTPTAFESVYGGARTSAKDGSVATLASMGTPGALKGPPKRPQEGPGALSQGNTQLGAGNREQQQATKQQGHVHEEVQQRVVADNEQQNVPQQHGSDTGSNGKPYNHHADSAATARRAHKTHQRKGPLKGGPEGPQEGPQGVQQGRKRHLMAAEVAEQRLITQQEQKQSAMQQQQDIGVTKLVQQQQQQRQDRAVEETASDGNVPGNVHGNEVMVGGDENVQVMVGKYAGEIGSTEALKQAAHDSNMMDYSADYGKGEHGDVYAEGVEGAGAHTFEGALEGDDAYKDYDAAGYNPAKTRFGQQGRTGGRTGGPRGFQAPLSRAQLAQRAAKEHKERVLAALKGVQQRTLLVTTNPAVLSKGLTFDEWEPIYPDLPTSLPSMLLGLIVLLSQVSLALALINALPLSGLDGQLVLSALLSLPTSTRSTRGPGDPSEGPLEGPTPPGSPVGFKNVSPFGAYNEQRPVTPPHHISRGMQGGPLTRALSGTLLGGTEQRVRTAHEADQQGHQRLGESKLHTVNSGGIVGGVSAAGSVHHTPSRSVSVPIAETHLPAKLRGRFRLQQFVSYSCAVLLVAVVTLHVFRIAKVYWLSAAGKL